MIIPINLYDPSKVCNLHNMFIYVYFPFVRDHITASVDKSGLLPLLACTSSPKPSRIHEIVSVCLVPSFPVSSSRHTAPRADSSLSIDLFQL